MNAEISKIRKLRKQDENYDEKPCRIEEKEMTSIIYKLNKNMALIYYMHSRGNLDISKVIDIFVENTYIILETFDKMHVYPDYFYDKIVKMNIKYRNLVTNDNSLRGNYQLFSAIDLSSELSREIKDGIKNKYYNYKAYYPKDLNDAFLEMVSFFEAFKIPHYINTPEHYIKIFSDIEYNYANIINELSNSDYLFVDIECLSRLLFEHLSFFVSIGVHPKELLDDYIESSLDTKHR